MRLVSAVIGSSLQGSAARVPLRYWTKMEVMSGREVGWFHSARASAGEVCRVGP